MGRLKKRKLVKVLTEKSQGPWNRTKKQEKADIEGRRMANRIHQLETHIAKLSTGNSGVALTLRTTEQVINMLEAYTSSGMWGATVEETAEEMLRDRVRMEGMDEGGGGGYR